MAASSQTCPGVGCRPAGGQRPGPAPRRSRPGTRTRTGRWRRARGPRRAGTGWVAEFRAARSALIRARRSCEYSAWTVPMDGGESAGRTVRGELDVTTKSPTRRVSAAPAAQTTHRVRPDQSRPRPVRTLLSGTAPEPVNFPLLASPCPFRFPVVTPGIVACSPPVWPPVTPNWVTHHANADTAAPVRHLRRDRRHRRRGTASVIDDEDFRSGSR